MDPNNNIGNGMADTPMSCWIPCSFWQFSKIIQVLIGLYPRPLVYQYPCVLCALGWFGSPSWVGFVAYTLVVSTSLLC